MLTFLARTLRRFKAIRRIQMHLAKSLDYPKGTGCKCSIIAKRPGT